MKRILTISTSKLIATLTSCYYDKAAELYPDKGCVITDVKYSADIQPIVGTSCSYAGCHEARNPAGNIDLTTYAGLKAVVQTGQLIGSITHASDYSAMPKNTNKLSDCNISRIRAWIDAGALDN
jgi:cytochrome c553